MSSKKITKQVVQESDDDLESDVDEEEEEQEEIMDDDDIFEDEDEVDLDYNADMIDALTTLFTTEQGDNVCTALVKIAKQMETQNKIMLKMLTTLQKK